MRYSIAEPHNHHRSTQRQDADHARNREERNGISARAQRVHQAPDEPSGDEKRRDRDGKRQCDEDGSWIDQCLLACCPTLAITGVQKQSEAALLQLASALERVEYESEDRRIALRKCALHRGGSWRS